MPTEVASLDASSAGGRSTGLHLLDVNVLVALAWPQHVHHERAHRWLEGSGTDWATTPITETAFLRISLNPDVVGRAVAPADALAVLRAMHDLPAHRFLADDVSPTRSVIVETPATRHQVTDLHLVHLAASAGAVLATLDRGIPRLLGPESRRHVVVLP